MDYEIDLTNVKTIRQLSEEVFEAAYDANPNHAFVQDMEEELELKGFLTERQRKRLAEIADGK